MTYDVCLNHWELKLITQSLSETSTLSLCPFTHHLMYLMSCCLTVCSISKNSGYKNNFSLGGDMLSPLLWSLQLLCTNSKMFFVYKLGINFVQFASDVQEHGFLCLLHMKYYVLKYTIQYKIFPTHWSWGALWLMLGKWLVSFICVCICMLVSPCRYIYAVFIIRGENSAGILWRDILLSDEWKWWEGTVDDSE